MSLRKKLWTGIIMVDIVYLPFLVIDSIRDIKTESEIINLIDRDHNGKTSIEEWTPVYEFFSKKPNYPEIDYRPAPYEFTREQLEQYLQTELIKHTGGKIK